MKLLLCLLIAVAAVTSELTHEQKRNWKKWSEECQAQTGVSQETINQVRNNQFDNINEEKIEAHSLCFAKKSGLAKENGDIDVDTVKTRLRKVVDNEEEVERIVTKCVVKKETQGKTAIHVFKCLRENKPKFSPV